ncbi:hypothetical protein [Actinomadura rudentiformis]|uniref:Uncharacterized protein n=1 Tax=Actinomadura rudentiformis TaxID=359158 RepID=A0A6H9YPW1_9ACTN|nr:hypothetical protein [Actinomadura rudentiformis]KAB2342087.1 hypothetical protein F8566_39095 [Actinomadura rudentiformis]
MMRAEDVALLHHLVQLSDIQFAGAQLGIMLSWASFSMPYMSGFATGTGDADKPSRPWAELFPHAPIPKGGVLPDHEERRLTYWQPAADAPASLHLAWLLHGLADELHAFSKARLDLQRLDVVDAAYADIAFYHGALCTVRVQLADRVDPLDFPGILIRESLEDHFRAHRSRDALIDLCHRL